MIINVDFDGTCTTHEFPYVGKEIGAAKVLKRLVDNGHKLILFTMRDNTKGVYNDKLTELSKIKDEKVSSIQEDAVTWFKNNDIPLYGIQTNPQQFRWTKSPKSYADMIIDDTALGCPLKNDENLSPRPFVDWDIVETLLEQKGLFNKLSYGSNQ